MTKGTILLGILFGPYVLLHAQETSLGAVIVHANKNYAKSDASSKTHIDEQAIQALPKGNGNINEVLKFLPDIQTEGNTATSENAGEIEPENLSISGAKFYQNNFQIDGLSNNSLLDPANDNPNQINDVKGHPQEVFIDTDMIKSIDLYDSDVPAKYGGFLGGVIDAKTKHVQDKLSGKIKYRYTSDSLTSFHVDDTDEFEYSRSSSMQPKFSKSFYGASINIPISDTDGVYIDISKKTSVIPLKHFDKTKSESRNLYNYLAKYSKFFDNNSVLDISLSYSPYEENRFLKNVGLSDYTIKGGGIKGNISYEYEDSEIISHTILGYSRTQNSRSANANFYNWGTSDTFSEGVYMDSEVSTYGGYGDISKIQNIYSFKNDFVINSIANMGFDLQYGSSIMDREEQSAIYKVSSIESSTGTTSPQIGVVNLKCFGEEGCIEGEQFANTKNLYHKYKAKAEIMKISSYLEKDVDFDFLEFRLGVRYDYNDYMQNHDIAYRSLAKLDVFNDKETLFSVGFNRYYGNSFLTYKLREAKKPYITYTRALLKSYDTYGNQIVRPGAWEENSRRGSSKTKYSDLNTPYSDEKSFGFTQKIFAGTFIAKKIYRENRDNFSQKYGEVQSDGYRYYELSNDGKSSHESLRLSYEIGYKNHYLSLNFNRSKTKSTNETYDDSADEEFDDSVAFFAYLDSNGKKQYNQVLTGELSKKNDTKPDIYKLLYRYNYNKKFKITSFVNYRNSYKKITNTYKTKEYSSENPATGEYSSANAPIYELVKFDPYINVDLSLEYIQKIFKNQSLVLRTDITNVFNKKQKASATINEFALGRQIWLEANYIF